MSEISNKTIKQDLRDPFESQAIRQVKLEEKAGEASRKEYDFKEALIEVLSTRAGKIVFARLFDNSGLFASAFDTNALAMARKEGKKEFAQEVFNYVMKYAPGLFHELRNE